MESAVEERHPLRRPFLTRPRSGRFHLCSSSVHGPRRTTPAPDEALASTRCSVLKVRGGHGNPCAWKKNRTQGAAPNDDANRLAGGRQPGARLHPRDAGANRRRPTCSTLPTSSSGANSASGSATGSPSSRTPDCATARRASAFDRANPAATRTFGQPGLRRRAGRSPAASTVRDVVGSVVLLEHTVEARLRRRPAPSPWYRSTTRARHPALLIVRVDRPVREAGRARASCSSGPRSVAQELVASRSGGPGSTSASRTSPRAARRRRRSCRAIGSSSARRRSPRARAW